MNERKTKLKSKKSQNDARTKTTTSDTTSTLTRGETNSVTLATTRNQSPANTVFLYSHICCIYNRWINIKRSRFNVVFIYFKITYCILKINRRILIKRL